MALTKRHLWIIFSAIFLLIALGFAASALQTIRVHHLPIPMILSAVTVALPLITGFVIQFATTLSNRSFSKPRPDLSDLLTSNTLNLTTYSLTILIAALAALIAPYIAPIDSLNCGLETQWRSLFHGKNEDAIRTIQDALSCCGLHSGLDMAWPFPSKNVKAGACMQRYPERQGGCFEMWRGEERRAAGTMLGVVVVVSVWMLLTILLNKLRAGSETPWYQSAQGRVEEEVNGERVNLLQGEAAPRTIGYRDEEAHREDELLRVARGNQSEMN